MRFRFVLGHYYYDLYQRLQSLTYGFKSIGLSYKDEDFHD